MVDKYMNGVQLNINKISYIVIHQNYQIRPEQLNIIGGHHSWGMQLIGGCSFGLC